MGKVRIIQIEASVQYVEPDSEAFHVTFVIQVENNTGVMVGEWGVSVTVTETGDERRDWIPVIGTKEGPNRPFGLGVGSLHNGHRDEVTVSFMIPISFGEGVRRLQYGNAPCKLEFRIVTDSGECDRYQHPETGVYDLSGVIYPPPQ